MLPNGHEVRSGTDAIERTSILEASSAASPSESKTSASFATCDESCNLTSIHLLRERLTVGRIERQAEQTIGMIENLLRKLFAPWRASALALSGCRFRNADGSPEI